MSEQRITVGYVRRAHGIGGDVLIRPLSDDPDRFVVGAVFMTDESPPRSVSVTAVRSHNEGLLLSLDETTDRTGAEGLRGVSLTIAQTERRRLDSDEYWPDDLEGLTVLGPAGGRLGTVSAVITGAAQDRLVITTADGHDVEVPFVAAIVPSVDLAGRQIHVDPPPGLFPD